MSYFFVIRVWFALYIVHNQSSMFVVHVFLCVNVSLWFIWMAGFDDSFTQYHHGVFYLMFFIDILLAEIFGQYLKRPIHPNNAYCSAFI